MKVLLIYIEPDSSGPKHALFESEKEALRYVKDEAYCPYGEALEYILVFENLSTKSGTVDRT